MSTVIVALFLLIFAQHILFHPFSLNLSSPYGNKKRAHISHSNLICQHLSFSESGTFDHDSLAWSFLTPSPVLWFGSSCLCFCFNLPCGEVGRWGMVSVSGQAPSCPSSSHPSFLVNGTQFVSGAFDRWCLRKWLLPPGATNACLFSRTVALKLSC